MADDIVNESWKLLKWYPMWNLETYSLSHTQVFFERRSVQGSKIMTLKWGKADRIERNALNGHIAFKIPDEILYPPVRNDLTICTFTPGDQHFIKRPCFRLFDPDGSPQMPIADLMIQEALVYERLKASPHPNIAKYWGCIEEGG